VRVVFTGVFGAGRSWVVDWVPRAPRGVGWRGEFGGFGKFWGIRIGADLSPWEES